ncbi:MAG: hypothetical protein HQK51_11455 [Oligoflexia bacterium]|nr:hypothetical protein [Oligoflexia bacterium]
MNSLSLINLFLSLITISIGTKFLLKTFTPSVYTNNLPIFSIGLFLYCILFHLLRSINLEVNKAILTFNTLAIFANFSFLLIKTLKIFFFTNKKVTHIFQKDNIDFTLLSLIIFSLIFSLIIGPYHEYPSDPIQHLKFISMYFYTINLQDIPVSHFSYFFSSMAIGKIDFITNYFNLNLYSAVTQTILLSLFYRLTFVLTKNKSLSAVCALLSLVFFGTNIFNFYRYYTFSKTFFTYYAYIEAMILLIESVRIKRISPLVWLLPPLFYCATNHVQEAIFIYVQIIFVPIILSLSLNKNSFKNSPFQYKLLLFSISNIAISSLIIFFLPNLILKPDFIDPQFLLFSNKISKFIHLPFVTINFFPHSPFFKTLGIWGIFAIIYSCFFLLINKKIDINYSIIASITVAPVIIITCPLTVFFLGKMMSAYLLYRLLYASMYWITFPLLIYITLKHLLSDHLFFLKNKYKYFFHLFIFISFSLSLFYKAPFWGRFYMLTYIPNANISGHSLINLISYLKSSSNLKNQIVLSDAYTEVFLSIHGLRSYTGQRYHNHRFMNEVHYYYNKNLGRYSTPEEFFNAIIIAHKIYAIIINKQTTESINGEISRHWKKTETNSLVKYSTEFLTYILNKEFFYEIRIDKDISIFMPIILFSCGYSVEQKILRILKWRTI